MTRSGSGQSPSVARSRRASAACVGREAGVGRKRQLEVASRGGVIAQRGRDRARVEAKQGVARPEPERLVGPRSRVTVATELVQRPGPGIGGTDVRRRLVGGLGERQRAIRVAMIGLEQRQIEVDHDAGRLEQLDLGAGQVDASRRVVGAARGRLRIGQGDHVLGQRNDIGCLLEAIDRLVETAVGDRQAALARECRGVARNELEGAVILLRGGPRVP